MYSLECTRNRNEIILMTPRYDYRCPDCKAFQIVVHDFHSQDTQTCPDCGGTMQKQYSVPGVVFRGSGFYKTDNR